MFRYLSDLRLKPEWTNAPLSVMSSINLWLDLQKFPSMSPSLRFTVPRNTREIRLCVLWFWQDQSQDQSQDPHKNTERKKRIGGGVVRYELFDRAPVLVLVVLPLYCSYRLIMTEKMSSVFNPSSDNRSSKSMNSQSDSMSAMIWIKATSMVLSPSGANAG